MRIFGGEKLKNLMNTLGLPDDMPIENKMISGSIESAQRKVEGYNFDIRKHLVEYDDVMNKHRTAIYKKRQRILDADLNDGIKEEIIDIILDQIEEAVTFNVEDTEKAKLEVNTILGVDIESLDINWLKEKAKELYKSKEQRVSSNVMRQIEKAVYLRTIDMFWVEHLTTMDELRTGIGLRGYGQRDPLVEYKQEAYRLFSLLIKNIESTVARTILKVVVQPQQDQTKPVKQDLEYQSPDPNQIGDIQKDEELINQANLVEKQEKTADVTTVIRQGKTVYDRMSESQQRTVSQVKKSSKVGRNDPCPCGSGKKYKKCCGK